MTYYGFYNEFFFLFGGCKNRGQVQRDGEMSVVVVHYVTIDPAVGNSTDIPWRLEAEVRCLLSLGAFLW